MLTSRDITDYFMDESGVMKHKNATIADQKEIDAHSSSIEAQNKLDTVKAEIKSW